MKQRSKEKAPLELSSGKIFVPGMSAAQDWLGSFASLMMTGHGVSVHGKLAHVTESADANLA